MHEGPLIHRWWMVSPDRGVIDAGAVAGWSSSVARWAHNPEVAGSNPAPATNPVERSPGSRGTSRILCGLQSTFEAGLLGGSRRPGTTFASERLPMAGVAEPGNRASISGGETVFGGKAKF